MRKTSVIGATLVAAAMLCAAPISLQLSQDKGLSLSVDKAGAVVGRSYGHGYYGHGYYGHGGSQAAGSLTCKEAAKLEFPTEKKSRRAYKKECKQAWKAQNGH